MWYNTKASKLLGAEYPILLGPFGGNLSTIQLTATVSNAGGVGGYGAYTLSGTELAEVDKQLKAATNKPYNINIWVNDTDAPATAIDDAQFKAASQLFKPYFDELGIPLPAKPPAFASRYANQVDVLLNVKPPVFSFMFGVPADDILDRCRRDGIVTAGAATTLDEALLLESHGVDMIIASGFEAGGHRPSFLAPAEASVTGTFALIQQIKHKVKTPIIAAGGIASGKGIAAALALGADAVQIGTAFLACDESNAPAIHKQLLFSDAAKYTSLTRAFTGRLGRGLTSRIGTEMEDKKGLPFPLQTQFMAPLRKTAFEQQKWDMVLFWGGQAAPILKHKKAKELMEAIVEETTAYFNGLK